MLLLQGQKYGAAMLIINEKHYYSGEEVQIDDGNVTGYRIC